MAVNYLVKSKCKSPINVSLNGEIFIIPAKPKTRLLQIQNDTIPEDLQKLIDGNIIKISKQ